MPRAAGRSKVGNPGSVLKRNTDGLACFACVCGCFLSVPLCTAWWVATAPDGQKHWLCSEGGSNELGVVRTIDKELGSPRHASRQTGGKKPRTTEANGQNWSPWEPASGTRRKAQPAKDLAGAPAASRPNASSGGADDVRGSPRRRAGAKATAAPLLARDSDLRRTPCSASPKPAKKKKKAPGPKARTIFVDDEAEADDDEAGGDEGGDDVERQSDIDFLSPSAQNNDSIAMHRQVDQFRIGGFDRGDDQEVEDDEEEEDDGEEEEESPRGHRVLEDDDNDPVAEADDPVPELVARASARA